MSFTVTRLPVITVEKLALPTLKRQPSAITITSMLLYLLKAILSFISLAWGFLESDFITFAVPNTTFGILSALTPSLLTNASSSSPSSTFLQPASPTHILQRLPFVLAFNISNLLVFDLANQRTERSVAEDVLNKPWRPILQGRITRDQTRRLMLAVIPAVMLLNHLLGAWAQGTGILVLCWVYNDQGGGDEAVVREMVIAVAYGMFNSGSLVVAIGGDSNTSTTSSSNKGSHAPSELGWMWVAIVSGVIFTTMQVQDLKDQAGDRARGRKTICLHMGEGFSRTTIAFFVCFWSCACAYFWALGPLAFLFVAVTAAVVVMRVLVVRSPKGDACTWRLWCCWHASLYVLPVLVTS
ncbi:Digeranylgeranylglyceryl phosphate synthase [Madurella mycetomatis]|uniref:Digeranylgeranylglyceryl phosphate synthase n=1 Tax=Madurella mycetomatis TaxID=100816 RepID=A0A175VTJ9_9PEZI|nr:Digeranylgeranylglyceryl phosphate synthase [Madurella mycetomatis]